MSSCSIVHGNTCSRSASSQCRPGLVARPQQRAAEPRCLAALAGRFDPHPRRSPKLTQGSPLNGNPCGSTYSGGLTVSGGLLQACLLDARGGGARAATELAHGGVVQVGGALARPVGPALPVHVGLEVVVDAQAVRLVPPALPLVVAVAEVVPLAGRQELEAEGVVRRVRTAVGRPVELARV